MVKWLKKVRREERLRIFAKELCDLKLKLKSSPNALTASQTTPKNFTTIYKNNQTGQHGKKEKRGLYDGGGAGGASGAGPLPKKALTWGL